MRKRNVYVPTTSGARARGTFPNIRTETVRRQISGTRS